MTPDNECCTKEEFFNDDVDLVMYENNVRYHGQEAVARCRAAMLEVYGSALAIKALANTIVSL